MFSRQKPLDRKDPAGHLQRLIKENLKAIGHEISVQTLRQKILDNWDLRREHYDYKWKRFLQALGNTLSPFLKSAIS